MGDRIWLTGLGLVTSLGHDVKAVWPRLVAGDRGLAPVTLFDAAGQRAAVVGGVDTSQGAPPFPGEGDTRWSRTSRFAWTAAREAILASGLGDAATWRTEGRRVGLVVGGTTGGMFETEALLAELHADPSRTDSLVRMITQPLTATGDRLGETLGPFYRVRTLCSACSSGANAFSVGATWLLAGDVDAVVVGGSDGLCRLTLSGFNALAAADPEPCRPFDAKRKGLNLGEGAGFAVIERATAVRARGGPVVAELAGWAIGAEAHHITNPEPSGVAASRVISSCLKRAGLSPREVDYVNAHGTATPLNDAMESAGLRLALGDETLRIPVSSSKGQVGHTLGAAGAVEAIFSALTVQQQLVPPTMGLLEPDGACELVHVMHRGYKARVRAALSNSFGFGGMDTVLLLTEPELGPPHSPTARRVVVTGAAAITAAGVAEGATAASLADAPRDAPASAGPIDIDRAGSLDPARARRLDRPARLGAIVAEHALAQAAAVSPLRREDVGLVLGIAFGSLDPSAAFMHRLFEKGPRLVSPAEFPNLVPSSPVGHVSIYHGLRGPAFATADLATSGESAVAQAVELIAGGDADVIAAGAVEEASELVERVLDCLYAWPLAARPPGPRRPRGEGAAALVLEAEAHAELRGARPLAVIASVLSWTDGTPPAVAAPRDVARARVLYPRDEPMALSFVAGSTWAAARASVVTPAAGDHEGLGAIALVAATALIEQGTVTDVLVVGTTRGRGYAIALALPSQAPLA